MNKDNRKGNLDDRNDREVEIENPDIKRDQVEDQIEEEQTNEIDQLEEKLSQANDKYIRLAAEFDNYRRRSAKERLELIGTASEEIIVGLLPILDDCERALQLLRDSSDSDAAKEGTELIYNKLMGYLRSRGLKLIEAKDKDLDTDYHEAVAQFPAQSKKQKNKVIDVIQQGYTLNGKVIRFAKVVVGV